MKTRIEYGWTGRRTARVIAAAAMAALAPIGTAAELFTLNGPVASDEQLDELRGGLSSGNEFNASFGITRTISINGDVVAVQGLVFHNLGNLFKGHMPTVEQLGQALTIVQVGPNNYAPAPGATAAGGGANGVALAAPAATMPITISGSSGGTTQGAATIMGGSFGLGSFGPSFASGIQNSLNDVRIQARTQIDAQVSALGLLKGNIQGGIYRDAMINSQMR